MDSIKKNLNWNEKKDKLKQKITDLTNNDILFTDDKKDELFGNLEIRLSKSKEEIRRIIDPLE
jgi:uncharacterized protein YjbJ (UPF0337 family)